MERTIRNIRLTASLLALAAMAGCAGAKPPPHVVWPPPPDVPRIKFVRTLSSSADVESGFRRFWRGVTGTKPLGLLNPSYLALSPDEQRLYVACGGAKNVVVFDFQSGKVTRAAEVEGHKPTAPWGIALDGDENLYVGDQVERVVWVYSRSGSFLRQIGSGKFERPAGLAFDRKRQLLYVVDGSSGSSRNHGVEVFAPDGRHLRTIGKRGEGPGEFNFPSYAAVARDGNLYVADTGNFRIEVFDPEGGFVTMMGSVGETMGQFGKTKGMAFDAFDNVYVVDGQVGVVQMFNARLQPLMYFGGVANVPGFMQVPTGIAIDSKNNIYVADYGMNHVSQYTLINTTAADSQAPSPPAPSPAADGAPRPSAPPASPEAADPRR